ncbi:hypothetical protein EDD37DRAFT_629293 [Exophiala viscosa]|uniref:DUF1772-domain-containing protein n=1 Tax=Exophiala viscosa TaxID=2486360 RepID=A0AAN6DLL9_9EURO|nr:hypothetical protein EDD36DRAFT_96162 [Exophiala viscosa]KAI1625306.1 hypothetical protein EDD37DRAFT_629293 [Exophiala viscosa]
MSYDSYDRVKGLFVIGTTTSAFLTGGLLFTSYSHVPGYLQNSSDESLLKQWQTMGAIGRAVMPPLILVASGSHFINAYLTHTQPQHYRFLGAGVLSLAVLPFTFLSLGPINDEIAARNEKKEDHVNEQLQKMSNQELIKSWGTLSAVRGFLFLASTLVSYDAMLHLTF